MNKVLRLIVAAAVTMFVVSGGYAQEETGSVIEVRSFRHIGGDCEMKGHNPSNTGYLTLSINKENQLVAKGCVNMKEDRPDYTEFEGCFSEVLQIVEPGQRIISAKQGRFAGSAGMNIHTPTRFDGTGAIDYAITVSDTQGNDCGHVSAEIYLNPIELQ